MPPAGITTVEPTTKSCVERSQPYVPAWRMPTTTKNRPAADRTAPRTSKFGLAPCTPGSVMRRARYRMTSTSSACTPNARRHVAALVIKPPISGPAAEPMPPAALMAPKASRARLDVVRENRRQNVDGRDQQRGPDPLAQRIAQDQAG